MEIYSNKDATGKHLTIHKEPVARGPAYFVDISAPSGGGLCFALSATSALNLARVLVWSAHADALEPAPEIRPPIPPMLRAVD